jgi:YVTN family beta-propeller protein
MRRARGCALAVVFSVLGAMLAGAKASAETHVYVVSGDALTVIDPSTQTVQDSIPVGASPARVAVSPDGTRVYVTNTGSSSVSVVETATHTVVATIPVGASPSAIAVTPDGQWLYITTAGGVVEAIDVALGTVVAPDPNHGHGRRRHLETFSSDSTGIEISPDGSRAYVVRIVDLFSGGLEVIDTGSLASLAFIGLGMPGQLAMAPDGSRLYAGIDATFVNTGYGAGSFPGRSVAVIDTVTRTQVASIDLGATGPNWTQQNTPKAIVVTPDKRFVYIAVPRIASVAAADVNTNLVVATVPVISPGALGANSDGSGTIVPFLIDAVDDTATCSSAGGTAIASVLDNDRLGGVRPTLLHVLLSQQSSTDPGVSLYLATGAVDVAAGATIGVQTLVYRICEIATPGNCDEATVTITVRAPYVIDAVDDSASRLPGGYALTNVLANDTLAGVTATLATVQLTQVSSTSSFIQLAPSTGGVFVYVGAPAGPHTIGSPGSAPPRPR